MDATPDAVVDQPHGMEVGIDVTGDASADQPVGLDVDYEVPAGPCSVALPIQCGDRLSHSTVTHGRPNTWSGYNMTARLESGRETLYVFRQETSCQVVAKIKNLTNDLDLLLLSGCDPWRWNEQASSTPFDLQTIETVTWTSRPGELKYLVVDGYDGAAGSYTVEVDCTCQ
jgi:hypothetical protein